MLNIILHACNLLGGRGKARALAKTHRFANALQAGFLHRYHGQNRGKASINTSLPLPSSWFRGGWQGLEPWQSEAEPILSRPDSSHVTRSLLVDLLAYK